MPTFIDTGEEYLNAAHRPTSSASTQYPEMKRYGSGWIQGNASPAAVSIFRPSSKRLISATGKQNSY